MRCRPSLVRGRAAQVNPGGFTTLREGHRCRIERPVAESPPRVRGWPAAARRCLMDPTLRCYSAVGFDVQCSRLLENDMSHKS